MKVLLVRSESDGASASHDAFVDESALLASRGHEVMQYVLRPNSTKKASTARASADLVWNGGVRRELGDLVDHHGAQVVHFHDVSPASLYGVPTKGPGVVQTLYDYRLMCPAGSFFRDGAVCEDCIGRTLGWPGVAHRCNEGSRGKSGAVVAMLGVHKMMGTWNKRVGTFVVPTEFARLKHIQGGISPRRIVVRPPFAPGDPRPGSGEGGYAIYVGGLSERKGIRTLLDSWRDHSPVLPLKIIGKGPAGNLVAEATTASSNIEWVRESDEERVNELIRHAVVQVVPSVTYEMLGRSVVRAFSLGTPVVASDLGPLAELVAPGRTGGLFAVGNAAALAAAVSSMADSVACDIRRACRTEYLEKFTAERSYNTLMSVYDSAIKAATA